jgi:histone deacetylase 6
MIKFISGQGVQREFLNEPAVLYASIHRYEHGKYCPHLRESDYDVIGEDPAQGTNVNIPLNESGLGDPDYLAIFHQIILPLAYEYNPELVLVSAGFDAAFGDPEGEMKVSPIMYGHMVSSLMTLAGGKVALVLEGGYFIETLAEGCAMALRALLGLDSIRLGQLAGPSCSVVDSILNSISALRPHWNNLQMQEEYSISEYDAAVDKNCHVPLLSYEGQSYLEKRDLDKTELDLNNFYWKNTDDSVAQFTATFRSMQVRYLDQLKVSKREIGLVYDRRMARHSNMEEPNHPERPERILEMIKRHEEYGLMERTVKIESRSASREELLLLHDPVYFDNMASLPEMSQKELDECSNGFDSVYFNPSSFECALLSCGSLLNVVDSVCEGNTQSGVAIIRPPGHHAEEDDACGFCIFNNVAVAAKHAIEMHGLKRVLILDWDVHHGNGIQNMFYDDPQVLYISVHRYDNGTFFPNRLDANYDFVGEGRGEGFNVNIPWNGSGMGDPEYTCALFNVILPIAYQFDPDLVLVSAGFDAARGDPLGFCKVSPEMYGHIVHQLRNLAGGKVIVALEGGYNLNTISLCMAMCTKALLGDPMPPISPAPPLASAVETIRRVSSAHSRFWSSLRFAKKLPGSFQDLKAQMGSIVKKKDSKLLFTVKKEDIDADDRKDDSKDNTDAADPVSSMAQRLGNVSLIDTKEEVDENVAIKSKHNETV